MTIYFNIRFILKQFMILCGIYPFYFLQPYWSIVYIPYSSPILIVQFDDFESIYLDVQLSSQSSIRTDASFQRVPSSLVHSISVVFSCPRRWSASFLCNFGFSRHFTYAWTHTENNFYIRLPSLSIMFLRFILTAWIIYLFFWLLLYAYPFTSWWIFGLLTDFGYYDWCNYWSFAYKWHIFSLLFVRYPGVKLLGHMFMYMSMFHFLRHCQAVFQSGYAILHSHQQCMQVSLSPCPPNL